eukprot:4675757-Alexandrium_andersonii.AAC.1
MCLHVLAVDIHTGKTTVPETIDATPVSLGPAGEQTQGARPGRSAHAARREGQTDCRVGGT